MALFPKNYKKEYDEISWKEQFENPNRVCYVIEKLPEMLYCGECVIKDISVDIPEVEIELLQEYRYQGMGYLSMVRMLGIMSEKYGKREFYAKIEPDNYAGQFLFEKLGGVPAGIVKDLYLSDERANAFSKNHTYLLNERMNLSAKMFNVEAEILLTHLLIYKIEFDRMNLLTGIDERKNRRKYIECSRTLSKEKYKDVLHEWAEDLEEMTNMRQDKDKMSMKIAEMEAKLLGKIEGMNTIDLNSN